LSGGRGEWEKDDEAGKKSLFYRKNDFRSLIRRWSQRADERSQKGEESSTKRKLLTD